MAPLKKGDLNEEEKELLEVLGKGNTEEAARLLGNKNVRVNCLDEHGMTPLMHAAYKGKVDMCKLLLRHGADVNCNEHEQGYTALMFAGLSGNKEITWMMLEAGADTGVVNSVGRTAAQMAAFVGQHDCVTVINNFFSRERLDYYTKPQGLDKEPKLPVKLAGPLHKIITTTNLHPVKIVLLVKENPLLTDVEALQKCYYVLDLICEKCMKQRDMNEVLAMKMHYISCIFQKCILSLKEREDKLDGLIKSLLKGRDKDGFPVYQEKLIRECIRKFPYCEATLLQQLVRSIAPVEIVIYCDQNCQKMHWFTHKKACKMLKEAHEKQEREAAKEKQQQERKQKKEAAQAAESISNQEQLMSGDSKEVEPKCEGDKAEKIISNKEIPVLSSPADILSKEETDLTDTAIEKAHESEE
ncbi:PREDICTED: ankyrin repeat and MYND domain-containing protein 2 isoform X2 [Gekko japonicus]|uniref:Ankyrin repeat and MYND domain-containing protein 2 isoform X2 n=1 Tax=Gekko japonicus TaxID=146911 RepID=A0ABM1KTN1_GEKJA|nr:PREDICTED: ankyrin repeat and MYND domain-containing protein 2 isoform X2 [Gekko japonicus]